MGAISTVDTHVVKPHERLEYWNSMVGDILDGITVDSADADNFEGQILYATLGRLSFARTRCSEATVRWLGTNFSKPKEHSLVLHIQNQGNCIGRQGGRETLVRKGDLIFCDSSKPYSLELSSPNDVLAVDLPMEVVIEKLPESLNRILQVEPGSNPHVRLLSAFLLNLWQECNDSPDSSEWIDGVEDVLLDLLALTLKQTAEGNMLPNTNGLQKKLMACIQERLADPSLGTSILAEEAGISVRTVQTLFARMGTTPTAFILQQRLALAAKLLRSLPRKRITDIAYDAGFNDSAYFTRRFRQCFGRSPREFRAGM